MGKLLEPYNEEIKTHEFNTEEEAVNIIKEIYNTSEVCLGDVLGALEIQGCDLEVVVRIVAKARERIDGWNMYMTGDEETDVLDIAENEWHTDIKVSYVQ